MVLAAKVAVGLLIGLLVHFLFPGRHSVRPIAAAALGAVGAVLGAFLAQHLLAIGGPGITLAGLGMASAGALAVTLLYVATSH
jgi:uncharacterized membrane protein YeaQ/YmgE (transglycosylase-associated protein family)